MAKGYWISAYREIRDPAKLAAYAELAAPAVKANGGRFLARKRGLPDSARKYAPTRLSNAATISSGFFCSIAPAALGIHDPTMAAMSVICQAATMRIDAVLRVCKVAFVTTSLLPALSLPPLPCSIIGSLTGYTHTGLPVSCSGSSPISAILVSSAAVRRLTTS